jgi:hypothetical protein
MRNQPFQHVQKPDFLRQISTFFKLTVDKPKNQSCHQRDDDNAKYCKKPDLFLMWREIHFNSFLPTKIDNSKQLFPPASGHDLKSPLSDFKLYHCLIF